MTRKISVSDPLSETELVYMSDVALELARVAQDSGRPMLALIFRMAALEASNLTPDIPIQASAFSREPTSH
jgi:hypothetical protein